MFGQDFCRKGHDFAAGKSTVGFDFHSKFVKIDTLTYTCRLDVVIDLSDGRVKAVCRNVADRIIKFQLFVDFLILGCRNVTSAPADRKFAVETVSVCQSANVKVGIENFNLSVGSYVLCENLAGTYFVEGKSLAEAVIVAHCF